MTVRSMHGVAASLAALLMASTAAAQGQPTPPGDPAPAATPADPAATPADPPATPADPPVAPADPPVAPAAAPAAPADPAAAAALWSPPPSPLVVAPASPPARAAAKQGAVHDAFGPTDDSYAEPDKARRHEGIYLRLQVGPSHFRAVSSTAYSEFSVQGNGLGFAVAIGHAVIDDLIVYLEGFQDTASNPSVEANGDDQGTLDQWRSGVFGFGPGVAYYLPGNVYVSGTFAMSRVTFVDTEAKLGGLQVAGSETGFGLSASVGKEWWLTTEWGVGAAAQLYRGSIPRGDGTSWTTTGLMLALSATLN